MQNTRLTPNGGFAEVYAISANDGSWTIAAVCGQGTLGKSKACAPAGGDSLNAYMKWAVGDVLSYSSPGSEVKPDVPMPRWGWNGLE